MRVVSADDIAVLEAARRGEPGAFDRLVAPYRGELHAHCYRMLGSVHDAEDALQDALLGAWRGLPKYEGRASVRSWLYRIATNAALRQIDRRPKRLLSADYRPANSTTGDLGEPVMEPIWLEPYPETMLLAADTGSDPAARIEARESVELAFVAALQHLPATQRAVLILREVLAFSAAEVAELLDTSVASVNSALQRARASIDQRIGARSQQQTLRDLGDTGRAELMAGLVTAWERADVQGILDLLVEDARLNMPPLPAWFDGIDSIRMFLVERVFETRWRLVPMTVNGQLAFAGYQEAADGSGYHLGSVNVLTLRDDRIAQLTSFLDPATHRLFELPETISAPTR